LSEVRRQNLLRSFYINHESCVITCCFGFHALLAAACCSYINDIIIYRRNWF
jgi:hypothetical protein